MALVQVPYNNAMRLGQGFNTYTQEICIDNAVVGLSTAEDSQPIIPTPSLPLLVNGELQKQPESALSTVPKATLQDVLASASALATTTTTYPSQIVTYYSKYVDKLSDVSNNMNISGSLSIRYGEISGGASGSFVDVETFQDSDINFMISVKVVNQTINVKDQLTFMPLDADDKTAPSDSQFTQTYGDSFISGFQEGGQFFAIVSIKALDKSQKTEIKASAQLALQVGVGDVSGQADVEIAKANLQKNSQVNITVNWSGGGQLKEGGEKWDIDTLTEVAVRFPDLVAQCPQRTHAILTKYTALRGYLGWKAQVSAKPPLSYELANLYTSDLLDVYMGYKLIWDDIHAMLIALDTGTMQYTIAPEPQPPLLAPAMLAPDGHPLPQIGLHPFDVSFTGLDEAVRWCRMLMVRIVNEVQGLAMDPTIAVDPNRPSAYIRPALFRQLLPIPVPQPAPLPSALAALYPIENVEFGGMDGTKANNAVDTVSRPLAYLNTGESLPVILTGLTRLDIFRGVRSDGQTQYRLCTNTYASSIGTDTAMINATVVPDYLTKAVLTIPATGASFKTQADALVVAANSNGIQAGTYTTAWATHNPAPQDYVVRIYYPKAFNAVPNVVVMLAGFDRECTGAIDICVYAGNVTPTFFDLHIYAAAGDVYQASVGWLAFPGDAPDLFAGYQAVTNRATLQTWNTVKTVHINFPPGKFFVPPKVLVTLNGFAFGASLQLRLQTAAVNVSTTGFDWSVNTWQGSQMIDVGVTYIAIAQ